MCWIEILWKDIEFFNQLQVEQNMFGQSWKPNNVIREVCTNCIVGVASRIGFE
jgi:hypothetical protein